MSGTECFPATKDEPRAGHFCPTQATSQTMETEAIVRGSVPSAPRAAMGLRTTSGGNAETPFRFEMAPKCLKFGHPILRNSIRGTPDLRLYGVPYCPYGRMRLKFQTHPPGFEVNGPLAVPAVPGFTWEPVAVTRPHRPKRTFLRVVGCHCTQPHAFW